MGLLRRGYFRDFVGVVRFVREPKYTYIGVIWCIKGGREFANNQNRPPNPMASTKHPTDSDPLFGRDIILVDTKGEILSYSYLRKRAMDRVRRSTWGDEIDLDTRREYVERMIDPDGRIFNGTAGTYDIRTVWSMLLDEDRIFDLWSSTL